MDMWIIFYLKKPRRGFVITIDVCYKSLQLFIWIIFYEKGKREIWDSQGGENRLRSFEMRRRVISCNFEYSILKWRQWFLPKGWHYVPTKRLYIAKGRDVEICSFKQFVALISGVCACFNEAVISSHYRM
jgi:hypothetical protein